jgi:uncharacterized membrane protein
MIGVVFNAWLLSFHVLAAFALVGSLVLTLIVTLIARRPQTPDGALALGRVVSAGAVALRAGLVLVAALGVWLAFAVDGYSLKQGWIIAALILWFVIGALSSRAEFEYAKRLRVARERAGEEDDGRGDGATAAPHGALLASVGGAALLALAVLALMVWKPGA